MTRATLLAVLAVLSVALAYSSTLVQAQVSDPCSVFLTCNACTNSADLPNCGWCGLSGVCQSAQDTCPNNRWLNPASGVLFQDPTVGEVLPATQTVFLRAGQPLTVTITVKPQPCKPIDLYLLMDFSGSMSDDLQKVRDLAVPIADTVTNLCTSAPPPTECLNPNCARLGFGTYLEKPAFPLGWWRSGNPYVRAPTDQGATATITNHVFRSRIPLTYDLSIFVNLISGISGTTGNRDGPENPIDGLLQAILCRNLTQWDTFTTTEPRRIILVLTDETYHFRGEGVQMRISDPFENQCYLTEEEQVTLTEAARNAIIDRKSIEQDYPSFQQLRDALVANNIVPLFASVATGTNQRLYADLVKSLGFGATGALEADSSNIIQLIEDSYVSISKFLQIAIQSNGNEWLVQSTFPIDGYSNVAIGSDYVFTIDLLYDGTRPQANNLQIGATFVGFRAAFIVVNLVNACDCTDFCDSPVGNPLGKCSGHGTCECGKCNCEPTHSGDFCDCDLGLTNCISHTGSICSGVVRGSCQCNACVCNEGYGGDFCNCPTTGCPISAGRECAGHGSCSCGACVCQSGWSEDSNCLCPSVAVTDCDPVGLAIDNCSGHGTCTECATCQCFPGFTGPICEELVIPCIDDCSGHGTCDTSNGTCTCSEFWTGDFCSCATTCPQNCNGNGVCICGECFCNGGFSGPACACNEQCVIVEGQICAGHGTCGCNGQCTCSSGWAPPNCECPTNAVCPGSPTQCSGHGSCICGRCLCTGSYVGEDCSCNDISCTTDCGLSLGQGNCDCGQCVCNEGFSESTLCQCNATASCPTKFPGTTCSGHGACTSLLNLQTYEADCQKCACETDATGFPLWSGEDCSCSLSPCPGPTIGGKKCNELSGNGECICGECLCKNGYSRPEQGCDCAPCDFDCGAQGVCNCGTCECAPFWIGERCDFCDITQFNNTCGEDPCKDRTSCKSCADAGCSWCDNIGACWNYTNSVSQCSRNHNITDSGRCRLIGDLTEAEAIGVFTGASLGLIALVLLGIGILKFVNMYRDKREWAKFEMEKVKSRWKGDDNPLFKSSTVEYSNPLYGAGNSAIGENSALY